MPAGPEPSEESAFGADRRSAAEVRPAPSVILIAGPGGAGKSTTAARIAEEPGWVHVSEDDHWVAIKADRSPGELRTHEEQDVVQAQVIDRVRALVAAGQSVVLELILYEDPPRPLLRYQEALAARGVPAATRILRPSVDEILRRMAVRDRPRDAGRPGRRADAEHQVLVLGSPHIDPDWVVDTTDLTLEEVYRRHFAELVEG